MFGILERQRAVSGVASARRQVIIPERVANDTELGYGALSREVRLHVAVVVAQRGGVENYCSIAAAKDSWFWGHSPAQCEEEADNCAKAARFKEKCTAENSTKANEWAAEVELRFDVARQELSHAGQLWLDVPFEQFVAEGGGEARSELAVRILDHLDLGEPEVWDTCGLLWCANYSWPY